MLFKNLTLTLLLAVVLSSCAGPNRKIAYDGKMTEVTPIQMAFVKEQLAVDNAKKNSIETSL